MLKQSSPISLVRAVLTETPCPRGAPTVGRRGGLTVSPIQGLGAVQVRDQFGDVDLPFGQRTAGVGPVLHGLFAHLQAGVVTGLKGNGERILRSSDVDREKR